MSALTERRKCVNRELADYEPPFSRERLLDLFTSAPNAFWRHDVDISLQAAVRMARFAQVAGVKSTFYLNPRSDFYNLFSREAQRAIFTIRSAGHRIGLHCDLAPHICGVEWMVERDLKLLRADGLVLGAVPGVSFHMPDDRVLWRDFTGFESAYASKWEGRYVSDSRRRPITVEVTDDMQVNLHPEHWRI